MPGSHRVFFALWPDAGVARQFEETGGQAQQTLGGRRMRLETLHLTLAFVGGVAPERLKALADIAAAIRLPRFMLRFNRLECVRRKRIAWAAAEAPQELRNLVSALQAGLKATDFRTEGQPFAAHVTLLRNARCEAGACGAGLNIEWPVRDFVLAESELDPSGAAYRVVARWPLMDPQT